MKKPWVLAVVLIVIALGCVALFDAISLLDQWLASDQRAIDACETASLLIVGGRVARDAMVIIDADREVLPADLVAAVHALDVHLRRWPDPGSADRWRP